MNKEELNPILPKITADKSNMFVSICSTKEKFDKKEKDNRIKNKDVKR
ncbi:MAG: hypothetical protein AABX07_04340 [Nanoarchaeota archaeon]